MCILKLSKIPMYEFLYDYIKNKYGIKLRLLSTDTDSKMHEIETENVCNDFNKNKEMFDFSNYSAESKYHNDSKPLVVDKMKDEMSGFFVEELFRLQPKM